MDFFRKIRCFFNAKKLNDPAAGLESVIIAPNTRFDEGEVGVVKKSFITKIACFLGLKKKLKSDEFETMLSSLNSSAKYDQIRKAAYYRATNYTKNTNQKYDYTQQSDLLSESLRVDAACTAYHSEILKHFFSELQSLLSLLQSGIRTALEEVSVSAIEAKIRLFIVKHENDARNIFGNYEQAKSNLKMFKWLNKRTMDAVYPDQDNSLFLWGFAAVEAMLNIVFLWHRSSLIVAIAIASGTAAVNILANVFFGKCFRVKNHIELERRKSAKYSPICSALLILFIASVLFSYRYNIMVDDGGNSLFLIGSIVLVATCVGMGIAAFCNGYKSDDPYPEYGEYDRKVRQFQKELDCMHEKNLMEAIFLKESAELKLNKLDAKILVTFDSINIYLPKIEQRIKVWVEDRARVNFAYRQLQTIFKIIFMEHCSDNQKTYDEQIQDLPENKLLVNYKLQTQNLLDQRKDVIKAQMETLRGLVSSQKEALQKCWQSSSAEELLKFPVNYLVENNVDHQVIGATKKIKKE